MVDRAAGARAVVPEEVAVPEGAVAVAAVAAVASPEAPGAALHWASFPPAKQRPLVFEAVRAHLPTRLKPFSELEPSLSVTPRPKSHGGK